MKTSELKDAALDWAVGSTGEYGVGFFSTDWAQGGPIIERENIGIGYDADMGWIGIESDGKYETGPTPLIAAMRCFVASKLGDEIDLPKDLT